MSPTPYLIGFERFSGSAAVHGKAERSIAVAPACFAFSTDVVWAARVNKEGTGLKGRRTDMDAAVKRQKGPENRAAKGYYCS